MACYSYRYLATLEFTGLFRIPGDSRNGVFGNFANNMDLNYLSSVRWNHVIVLYFHLITPPFVERYDDAHWSQSDGRTYTRL